MRCLLSPRVSNINMSYTMTCDTTQTIPNLADSNSNFDVTIIDIENELDQKERTLDATDISLYRVPDIISLSNDPGSRYSQRKQRSKMLLLCGTGMKHSVLKFAIFIHPQWPNYRPIRQINQAKRLVSSLERSVHFLCLWL